MAPLLNMVAVAAKCGHGAWQHGKFIDLKGGFALRTEICGACGMWRTVTCGSAQQYSAWRPAADYETMTT